MPTYRAVLSALIEAPTELVYSILADYRNGHPLILPKPYFIALQVEQGGIGAGSLIQFQMRILGKTQNFRAAVTEPEPGRILVETNFGDPGSVTTFVVEPSTDGKHARVEISTEGKTERSGVLGRMERFFTEKYLQRIYVKELNLLAELANKRAANATNAATS